MKTADFRYFKHEQDQKVHITSDYLFYWMLGMISGGIVYMKLNTMEISSILIAALVALVTGFAGAAGKYFFDKKGKKWLDKLFKRKRK